MCYWRQLIIRLNGKANGFQKDADGIVRYQLIYHPACRVFLCLGVLKNSPELHTPYKNELKIKQKSNLFSVMLKKLESIFHNTIGLTFFIFFEIVSQSLIAANDYQPLNARAAVRLRQLR